MLRRFHIALLAALMSLTFAAQAACDWPAWQSFKQNYLSPEGRVIDPSSDGITTSEGQSYALFFALVANDKPAFELIFNWTEANLAGGDLTARLPAWLWGKNDKGDWKILDDNSASDADLWIAYSLSEAGRLWKHRSYEVDGALLRQRIAREEVVKADGLGYVLLPGKTGFTTENGWKLNPSYQPPQLLARFASSGEPWNELVESNLRLLTESAPKGFAPDWIVWGKNGQWRYDDEKKDTGSYDAIRVYLWTGMLADGDKQKAVLTERFKAMAAQVESAGFPPESVATESGGVTGEGPIGFSAALLPFLADSPALAGQRERVRKEQPGAGAYYNAVLTLFGQGWDEGRYRFNERGELLPNWSDACADSR